MNKYEEAFRNAGHRVTMLCKCVHEEDTTLVSVRPKGEIHEIDFKIRDEKSLKEALDELILRQPAVQK